MDRIVVRGSGPLRGEVAVSGSKNSALALMAGALLARGETVLENVPWLRDIDTMLEILRALGARAEWQGEGAHAVCIDASRIHNPEAPYDLVRKMRASFLVLGPLLARCGAARVSEPGGCAIGVRPVDQHLKGFEALGAKLRLDHGYVDASAARLRGGHVAFDVSTVNGTQNVMMAASLADGETVLENAAREPEVVELAELLLRMGADVRGAGTDRIEAGTLLCAAMVTQGELLVAGVDPAHLESTLDKLRECGADIETQPTRVLLRMPERARAVRFVTAPYPGFPTDMQAQLMAVLCSADGSSVVTERVFENRFMHVPELQRMGADIALSGRSAHVTGVPKLAGAPVMATDLRASAGLIVAALAAEGETVVSRVYHIDRGYERIEEKLRSLGADIRREG